MDTATIHSQARQMWDTRPLRARHAPIFGVCTGFARRYQVDVALVRVAMIGATLVGGAGAVAYIAGIFLLPKEPDRPLPPVERAGPPPFVLVIAAGIALLAGGALSTSWPGAWLVSAALLLFGWYALAQRVPVPPPGTSASSRGLGDTASPSAAWQPPAPPRGGYQPKPHTAPSGDASPQAGGPTAPIGPQSPNDFDDPTPTEQITPPQWDPLGAAPFAWDLPEPATATAVPATTRRRSRITSVTLGAALLTAAVLAAVNLTGLISVTAVFGGSVVLGVIGAGLVLGAFRRSGYGLLFAAIPLAGFVVIGATAHNVLNGFDGVSPGSKTFHPTAPAQLEDRYRTQAGDLTLDLTKLTLDRDRTVHTQVRAGNTRIEVPQSMNIDVTCDARFGETSCVDGFVAGVGADANGPTLTIEADATAGNVEVQRVR